jgi:hypothetical protein
MKALEARIAELESQKAESDDYVEHYRAELDKANARIPLLEAQIAAAEKREPVGIAGNMPGTEGFTMAAFKAYDVPVGTKLYAHPCQSDAEGWRKDAKRYSRILALEWESYARECAKSGSVPMNFEEYKRRHDSTSDAAQQQDQS